MQHVESWVCPRCLLFAKYGKCGELKTEGGSNTMLWVPDAVKTSHKMKYGG